MVGVKILDSMKKRAKLIAQIFGGIAALWLIVALFISWKETDRFYKLAREKNDLLLKEQAVSQKLRLQLDSCSQH